MESNSYKLTMVVLIAAVLATIALTVLPAAGTESAQTGPPRPLLDCTGCGWRPGYTCYACKDGVLWECGEYWDHCWDRFGNEYWNYCYCSLVDCFRKTGIPC